MTRGIVGKNKIAGSSARGRRHAGQVSTIASTGIEPDSDSKSRPGSTGGRPKKLSTITTDTGRIERHIIPLIGTRRVKDLTKTDINKVLKDIS